MSLVRVTMILVLAASAGCYRWVPHEGGPVPAGTDVRVRMTDAGSDAVGRRLGETEGSFTGPLAFWTDQAVAVTTTASISRPGFAPTLVTDTIDIPLAYLAGVDVKVLDRKNTTFLTAGIVVGAVGLVFATRALGGETDIVEGGGPPSEEAVIVRIPLGIGR